jgi:hypothetical protein
LAILSLGCSVISVASIIVCSWFLSVFCLYSVTKRISEETACLSLDKLAISMFNLSVTELRQQTNKNQKKSVRFFYAILAALSI